MKSLNKYFVFVLSLLTLFVVCCEKPLEIEPKSEFSGAFLETQEGIEVLLASAYSNHQINGWGADRIPLEECTTDVFRVYLGGYYNNRMRRYQDFSFDSGHTIGIQDFWRQNYRAIRDANILIAEIPDHPVLSDELKVIYLAEAKFIRATAYKLLYGWFGGVPLVLETSNDLFPVRASAKDIEDFVISELKAAAPSLPPTRTESEYGRATQGGALGVLAQFQLNTKHWDGAAQTAQDVIDIGVYQLLPNYADVFALDNEGNNELIHVFPNMDVDPVGTIWTRNVLPGDYPTSVVNAATHQVVPIPFYNTFDANDKRAELIITEYYTSNGVFVNLLDPNEGPTGDQYNHPRSFKYPIDEDSADPSIGGQDVPLIRYSEILLIRSEGLVMSTGAVSQEALDLLNKVRNRAGLHDYTLTDIPDQATFIDKILDERSWEFYSEGKRREDLIRHDRFIQNALDRGWILAKPFQRLFPIPQTEIDANENLVQNEGY
ncbi:RagB/SusD family nutrient uptake outer membrane protein [Arenibacter sp. ARW7G5Y1]|uniref:RagB/SusD family nutrient uptake outer membrane protein n=1 Tax=Arenibacter sp. ARW7G5Y1 TaxID=2135619 RepID=UPI000D761F39|nr:RagB/SusD family nutrient uptake outer membrane protein [Arenibacter sp. ARW7G5Y1]PXX21460.1 putative outer membrane starch-binding protein [Arenibacter sp. ARW7G5Y1]